MPPGSWIYTDGAAMTDVSYCRQSSQGIQYLLSLPSSYTIPNQRPDLHHERREQQYHDSHSRPWLGHDVDEQLRRLPAGHRRFPRRAGRRLRPLHRTGLRSLKAILPPSPAARSPSSATYSPSDLATFGDGECHSCTFWQYEATHPSCSSRSPVSVSDCDHLSETSAETRAATSTRRI